MRRRTTLSGFTKHRSLERLQNINRAWKYLTPLQRAHITLLVLWHSTPTILQIVEHIQYFYGRWLEEHLYPAHWLR